jgi:predicted enzyme related to lactoylglutathione lyase
MRIQSVTVGVPAADLRRAVEWYRTTFELDTPDLEPSDGIVEFKLGPVWVQLVEATGGPHDGSTILRLGVHDASAERDRLKALGVAVGELENVDNVIEYFDFPDPDGNRLGLYAEVEP